MTILSRVRGVAGMPSRIGFNARSSLILCHIFNTLRKLPTAVQRTQKEGRGANFGASV